MSDPVYATISSRAADVRSQAGAASAADLTAHTEDSARHAPAAANDTVLGRDANGAWIQRTVAQFRTWLGLGSAAYTDASDYAEASVVESALADLSADIATRASSAEVTAALALKASATDLSGAISTEVSARDAAIASAVASEVTNRNAAIASAISSAQRAGRTISGTSDTFALADAGTSISCTSANAVTLTIPSNASVAFQARDTIEIVQEGVGQVTIAAAGGVTLLNTAATAKSYGQGGILAIRRSANAADTWILTGDRAAS